MEFTTLIFPKKGKAKKAFPFFICLQIANFKQKTYIEKPARNKSHRISPR